MTGPARTDEAQRALEQRALRNVRGLVDKMEGIDRLDERKERRTLLWIAIGAVVLAAILGFAVWQTAQKHAGKPVVIDPAKLPPIRPGPPPATR